MRLRTVLFTPLLVAFAAHAQTLPAQPTSAPALLPIPDEKSQDRARMMIVTLFKDDYAKTAPADRQALAKRLLSEAAATRDDPTARYVLLQDTIELAALSGDPTTAVAAANELARLYTLDPIALKKQTLFESNAAATSPAAAEATARFALDTADEAALLDDFASVQQFVNLAESAANKTRNVPFVSSIQPRLFDFRSLIADYPKVQKMLEHLAADTADADAHLFVGRFYALRKGQWTIGLPHLAMGSDARLRNLATLDLSNPADGLQQAQLGDAWWDYAQTTTNSTRTHIEAHARDWYHLAQPNLAGLTLTRIQSRMQGDATTPATASTPNAQTLALLPLIDITKDTIDGKWSFINGVLQCTAPSRNALIAIPYVPPEEYDLRITFTRTEGQGPLTILLTSHGKAFGFALDVKGDARFERLAGKIAKDNPTAAPVVITNNHRYILTLQIHKDLIRALLDDKPITQWKTDYKDLARYAIWKLPDEKLCAIGINNSKATIYDIQLVELAGKGHPSR
ncbi:MAG TPA: hypothetical protein VM008_13635 [Phycisphaerae bacterium]|nr:hypothetical protein [Phycisphaerae bacterium]